MGNESFDGDLVRKQSGEIFEWQVQFSFFFFTIYLLIFHSPQQNKMEEMELCFSNNTVTVVIFLIVINRIPNLEWQWPDAKPLFS